MKLYSVPVYISNQPIIKLKLHALTILAKSIHAISHTVYPMGMRYRVTFGRLRRTTSSGRMRYQPAKHKVKIVPSKDSASTQWH